ncbi:MAG: methionine ABC transporter ATP-binding protein [Treponema sp.]|nr:methionine ABC transporter ATP-binding protein [Treponema sp.]
MNIELKNLDKLYGSDNAVSVHAVNNVSLHIPSNEIFGIIGKSGAGKSTLVRLISLLEKPDSGEVWYDSTRVDNLEGKALIERRRRIGMIFQNFNLFSSRNAEQNIAYPMEITGTPKAKIKQRTRDLLELVGLSERAKSPVSQLSGGQKQRIAIARALANEPDILFCDEATSALDPKTTRSILDLIRKIQKQMNLTVVMITHQMEVVRDACSHVAVVNEGQIVEQGTVKEIFMNPKSPVTKDFLNHLAPEEDAKEAEKIVRWSNDGGNYYLRFYGDKTDMPLLSQTAKKFDIEYNIRAGGIQSVQGDKVGAMLIDFIGDEAEIQRAIEFLKENGVGVEKNESDN